MSSWSKIQQVRHERRLGFAEFTYSKPNDEALHKAWFFSSRITRAEDALLDDLRKALTAGLLIAA